MTSPKTTPSCEKKIDGSRRVPFCIRLSPNTAIQLEALLHARHIRSLMECGTRSTHCITSIMEEAINELFQREQASRAQAS